MLQKLNSRRGGFTLVEIMIVVAIIALLAAIAVPNFLRARQRSQATAVKQDLRMIDAAMEQWAIEGNHKTGDQAKGTDLKPYIKENSPLYANLDTTAAVKNTIGNAMAIPALGTKLVVDATTVTDLSAVADDVFWSPYK